jgi:acyl-CoA synthetase (AMP-forming)/AMP-acid ligase II
MTVVATLADLLSQAEPRQPAVALPDNGSVTTHRNLADQVEALAAVLRQSDLYPGQAVAIVLPNGLEYLAAFLAVTRARLIAAPLNPAYKPDEFRFYLRDIAAQAIIVPPEAHPVRDVASDLGLLLWNASRDPHGRTRLEGHGLPTTARGTPESPLADDIALFLHTSGTTSRPKGVPLTHANLMASVRNIAAHYRLTPADTGLVVMPLFHVHGLIGATLAPLFAGGAVVVPPRFSAGAFWPAAQAHRVTWYSCSPTIHQILLARADSDDAPSSSGFRFIRSCSAALAPATLAQLENRFGAPVLEAYAMTEASHQMCSNPLPPHAHKPGTVGRGTNVDVAIMDEGGALLPTGTQGEVVVRGPNVTRGYHNNPEANAVSFTKGWFRTGDRGVLDGEGYLTLVGRIKELINRGGEKISPLEIDVVLLAHPAVLEVATFAAPDPKYGEEVHVAVVLKGSATIEELQAHCRSRLADFKVPKVVYVTNELPRTATGKVLRRHVAATFLSES